MPGPPSVNGVKNKGSVRPLADGGAGRGLTGQPAHHRAVFHQGIQRADGAGHIIPHRVLSGDVYGDCTPHRHIPQGGNLHSLGLQVCGEHDLIRANRRRPLALHDLLHRGLEFAADGERALLDAANHVDALGGVAGGVVCVEFIGIKIDARGGAGLVQAHNPAVNGVVFAVLAVKAVAEVRAHVEIRASDDGGSIRAEPGSKIAAVAAADLAVCHN